MLSVGWVSVPVGAAAVPTCPASPGVPGVRPGDLITGAHCLGEHRGRAVRAFPSASQPARAIGPVGNSTAALTNAILSKSRVIDSPLTEL